MAAESEASDTTVIRNEISQIDDIPELENLEKKLNGKNKISKELHLFIQLRKSFILLEEMKDNDTTVKENDCIYQGKYADVITFKETVVKKLRTKGKDYRIAFHKDLFQNDLSKSLAIIYGGMEELLKFIFQFEPLKAMAAFYIDSPQFDYPIRVKYQERQYITPEVIFSYLEKVATSKRDFVLNGDIRIHVLVTDVPEGMGKRKISDLSYIQGKKSCKITCTSVEDFTCLSKAIVVGRGLIQNPEHRNAERRKYLEKDSEIFAEQILLHDAAKVPLEPRPYTFTDVDLFQQLLFQDFRIVIFQKLNEVKMVYCGEASPNAIDLYLFWSNDHYSTIINVDKFLPGKLKFCSKCTIIYGWRRAFKHMSCKNICSFCFHEECLDFGADCSNHMDWQLCVKCCRYFPTNCFLLHQQPGTGKLKSVCDMYFKCKTCEKIVFNFEKSTHQCFSVSCKVCHCEYEKKEIPDHVCHIQKKRWKKEDILSKKDMTEYVAEIIHIAKPHYFFDVETQIINGKHEPILVIVQDEKGEEMAFYGIGAEKKFCEKIFSKEFANSIFISHGGRGYDNYFPLNYCYSHGIVPNVLFNGSQIMMLHIASYNITFKDNLYFLTRALSDLPKTMGLDIVIQKGFFPYKIKFPHTDKYVIDFPPKELFLPETMKQKRREEFEKYYLERKDGKFDYFRELLEYCSQDVRILRLAAMKFRKLIIEMGLIDPYQEALTLAHLSSLIYKKKFMQADTIAIIPHNGLVGSGKAFSVKSIKYLEYIMKKRKVHIKHAMNGGERTVLSKKVDGFIESKPEDNHLGEVFEFAGCFFHGHCLHYNPEKYNYMLDKTYGELFREFMTRVSIFRKKGYLVHTFWECEYDSLYQKDLMFREFVDSLEIVDKLEPGDCLYGGRNEVFSMYRKVQGDEKICYLDFMSLYPAVMSMETFPIGPPSFVKLLPDVKDVESLFGIAKVKILPPQNLPVARLPFRHKKGEKIFYTLCRTCSFEKNCKTCCHTEQERAIIGTYTSFELQLAMKKGYKILKCFELWGWTKEKQTKELFKEYIKTFFKMKLCSEGFPYDNMSQIEKECYCAKISEENELDIQTNEIVYNPGLRNTSKALLNSLWGKLSLRPGKSKSKYVTDPDEFFKMLRDDCLEIENIFLASENMVHISYIEKNKLPSTFTNVVIASMVTSYARCWLLEKCLDKLVIEQLLYVDTDSVVFVKDESKNWTGLKEGTNLGSLTDEIKGKYNVTDSIETWCASGNKSYSFKLKNNPQITCVKVKGFTLNLSCNEGKDISFKSMLDLVLIHPYTTLRIQQPPLFIKDKENAQIYTKDRFKVFKFNYDNKVVLDTLQTKPYGFLGEFPKVSKNF